MRILYLLQFLYQSTNELCSILSAAILHCWEVHGICSDRKQAYKNIASLQDLTQILFASKARRIDASLAPAVWGIFFRASIHSHWTARSPKPLTLYQSGGAAAVYRSFYK